MTHDEIRKLLAGYATNTLTEAERKSLFEAALEDQELFDALQQEQGLKELLADPVTRAQVQQALRREPAAWWTRWWAWGSAASAVAATVLIVAVVNQSPRPSMTTPATPPEAKATSPAVTLDAAKEQAAGIPRSASSGAKRAFKAIAPGAPAEVRKDQKQEVAAAAPPPPPPQTQAETAPPSKSDAVQTAHPQVAQQQQQSQSPMHDQLQTPAGAASARATAFRDTEAATRAYLTPGTVGGYASNSPLLRFSLLKRTDSDVYVPVAAGELHTGDAVRLNVAPPGRGYLFLSRVDDTGEETRIFPATGPGIRVVANGSYTIPPDSAIQITDKEQKLRVTLVPQTMVETKALELGRMKESAKKAGAAAAPSVATPLVVNITIAAGR